MTSRTRKLTVGVAVVVIGIVLGLLLVREPGPSVVAALVGYDPGDTNVIIQIVNREGSTMDWLVGTSPPGPVVSGSIGPREVRQVPVPINSGSLSVRVYGRCDWTKSGPYNRLKHFLSEVTDIHLAPPWFTTNFALPPPPKAP